MERAQAGAREAIRIAEATDDLDSCGSTWLADAEVCEVGREWEEAAASLRHAINFYDRKGNSVLANRARERLGQLATEAVG